MSAQKGRELLLKIGDGGSPSDTFTTIGGLRSTGIAINDELVDVSNKSSADNWRVALAGASDLSATISGSGVFTDSVAENTLLTAKTAQTLDWYQVIVPGLGTFQGIFQVTSLEYTGEHNGEAVYNVTLESGGSVSFT